MYDIIIVNKQMALPKDYVPNELVPVRIDFVRPVAKEKTYMVRTAAKSLERLVREARFDGVRMKGVSAYRSYETQKNIFLRSALKNGMEHASMYVAMAGHSEHQTGLAIDMGSEENNYELEENFAFTMAYDWLSRNAYLYGYIIRYPKGKEEITGYGFEPWHIRYVGVPAAKLVHKEKKCLEEILLKC